MASLCHPISHVITNVILRSDQKVLLVHSIRLHGPWTCVVDENRHSFRVPGTIEISPSKTPILLVRVFQEPTGLDANPLIYLSGAGIFPESSRVVLNETHVGVIEQNQFRCEISSFLEATNQMTIEIGYPKHIGEIRIDRVCLEIDE